MTLQKERSFEMDKEQFITLSPTKRVEEVNRLLKIHSLKEIAAMLGFAYSTFTTEMRNGGEYQYNKKNKQYVKVFTSENSNGDRSTLAFIEENREILQRLVEMYQTNQLLLLDEKVYSNTATFENKSIKMNKDIYSDFSRFCETHYRHLKMQDLIAQALLDFMEKYKK